MKGPARKPTTTLRILPPALEDSLRTVAEDVEAVDQQSVRTLQELIDQLIDETDSAPGAIGEVLQNLAYNLEYFVADPAHRASDPSYFGPGNASMLAAEAMRAIEKIQADWMSGAQLDLG